MNWYLAALRHYADFSGRARRMEYWMFQLFYLLIYIVLNVVTKYVGVFFSIVALVYLLAMIIPSISVAVRRLHDIGRSGWWILIGLTGIGCFVLLYWYVKDSDLGSNAHGPSPKGVAAAPA